jgi:hypothetical protein
VLLLVHDLVAEVATGHDVLLVQHLSRAET